MQSFNVSITYGKANEAWLYIKKPNKDVVSITYGKANEFNVMRVWGNAYIPVSITYGKANITADNIPEGEFEIVTLTYCKANVTGVTPKRRG